MHYEKINILTVSFHLNEFKFFTNLIYIYMISLELRKHSLIKKFIDKKFYYFIKLFSLKCDITLLTKSSSLKNIFSFPSTSLISELIISE